MLRAVPLVTIVIGLFGAAYCSWRADQDERAVLVLMWCQVDTTLAQSAPDVADSPACRAWKISHKHADDIAPLLSFYKAYPNYKPTGQKGTE